MDTAFALLYFATLDLGVVALGHFEARSQNFLNFDALDYLFSTFALQVDAHDLAVTNGGVLDFHRVVGVRKAIDGSCIEILELGIRDENIRVHQNASCVVVFFVAKDRATGQVNECFGEGDDDGNPALELLLMGLERKGAVTEHDTARLHIADAVDARLDLELANALRRGLHCVLWVVGRIFFELREKAGT